MSGLPRLPASASPAPAMWRGRSAVGAHAAAAAVAALASLAPAGVHLAWLMQPLPWLSKGRPVPRFPLSLPAFLPTLTPHLPTPPPIHPLFIAPLGLPRCRSHAHAPSGHSTAFSRCPWRCVAAHGSGPAGAALPNPRAAHRCWWRRLPTSSPRAHEFQAFSGCGLGGRGGTCAPPPPPASVPGFPMPARLQVSRRASSLLPHTFWFVYLLPHSSTPALSPSPVASPACACCCCRCPQQPTAPSSTPLSPHPHLSPPM